MSASDPPPSPASTPCLLVVIRSRSSSLLRVVERRGRPQPPSTPRFSPNRWLRRIASSFFWWTLQRLQSTGSLTISLSYDAGSEDALRGHSQDPDRVARGGAGHGSR